MKYFGTDGIRGHFGTNLISEKFFKNLGSSVEKYLNRKYSKSVYKIAIGRDTRYSGQDLLSAFINGLSSNVSVIDCGVLPTPAIAEVVIKESCDLGAAITASHNKYTDNGIKFFNENGEKLTIDEEQEIEDIIDNDSAENITQSSVIKYHDNAKKIYQQKYNNFLLSNSLNGIKIAIDSANGATSHVVKEILQPYNAVIEHIGNSPNGININEQCGSECPDSMSNFIHSNDVYVGFSYDGDGDRVIVFDENGEKIDGDILIGILAEYMIHNHLLPNKSIVVTHQSNLALDSYIRQLGGNVIRCDIGDRNVYQTMKQHNILFGGENSGHLIFRQFSPIGDGITATLFILKLLLTSKKTMSSFKRKFALLPQKTFNILVDNKMPIEKIPGLQDDIAKIDAELPQPHRIVLRYSGTEPKLRALIEARERISVDHAWKKLSDAIINRLSENGIASSLM